MSTLEKVIRESMGSKERMTRILLGLVLIGLGVFYFGGKNGELLGLLLVFSGLLPLSTGIFNFCPLYSSLSLKLKKNKR